MGAGPLHVWIFSFNAYLYLNSVVLLSIVSGTNYNAFTENVLPVVIACLKI